MFVALSPRSVWQDELMHAVQSFHLKVDDFVWIKEHHFKVDNHSPFSSFSSLFFFHLSCWHLEKAIVAEWDRMRCTAGAFQIFFLCYHKVDIHLEREGWGSLYKPRNHDQAFNANPQLCHLEWKWFHLPLPSLSDSWIVESKWVLCFCLRFSFIFKGGW